MTTEPASTTASPPQAHVPSALRAAVGDPAEVGRPKTSSRDHAEVHAALTRWLTGVLPDGAEPLLGQLSVPSGNGMSSETLLFEASWKQDGSRKSEQLVARIAPDPAAAPVFEAYYLDRQYRTIELVRELTAVPVPNLRWLETDRSLLGEQFFVMDRVEGVVPTDLPPYALAGWVAEASPEQRQRLQDTSIKVLADLHAIPDANERFDFLLPHRTAESSLRQHVLDTRAYYEWSASDGIRSPLIERCFAWLEDNWPKHEGPTVLSWGDSRIGNMMYRDFAPVAVLDWEMASVAPPEVDLAWMAFMHFFFESMLGRHGMSGLPDLLRPADMAQTYAALSGYEPRDLPWYLTYNGLRYAIVMFRITRRGVLFGEMEMPENPDDMTSIREEMEALMAGTSSLSAGL
jgi:aminoglycoside phosphotransferase (APT) family kinase protein